MSDLTLDARTHTYRDAAGRRVPGVTEILRAAGLLSPMDFVSDYALDRGREVHAATALFDRGEADAYEFDPAVVPRLAAYRAWREAMGTRLVILEIETARHDMAFGFCGTPDRIVMLDRVRTVVEIKNGAEQYANRIQAAGYAVLTGAVGRVGVYLDGAGTFRMREWRDRQDVGIFQAALALWKTREAHGLLPVGEA